LGVLSENFIGIVFTFMQPRLGQSVIIEIGQLAARAIWYDRATLESQA
jgi:hypothetical protein